MALFSFPAQVNERAARTVAAVVALSLVLAIALQLRLLVPLLALGFLLRVGWGPRFSPLARAAMFTAARLWPVRPVSGAPKRFAQGIGALCTLGATALLFSGWTRAGWALAGVLILFATLEASLSFCMGCWIYARLQSAGLFPPDACESCGPLAQ
jgi:hypothetical protein